MTTPRDDRAWLMDAAIVLFRESGSTIEDAHAASLALFTDSVDRLLSEAAAVDATEDVKAWIARQLEELALHVRGWQPGRTTRAAPAAVTIN